jgi:hypothetical protein
MNIAALRVPLILGGLLGSIAALRVAAWPLAPIVLHASVESSETMAARASVLAPSRDSVAAIVSRDPFRIGRLPAITAYDPVRLAQPVAPPQPRPQLTLFGIVNGVEPSAVVEGLPGVEGSRVVRVGDVVAGLKIKQIGTNRVVIAGMDTTWVLEVREPWKN